jgi:hypothetical protein
VGGENYIRIGMNEEEANTAEQIYRMRIEEEDDGLESACAWILMRVLREESA